MAASVEHLVDDDGDVVAFRLCLPGEPWRDPHGGSFSAVEQAALAAVADRRAVTVTLHRGAQAVRYLGLRLREDAVRVVRMAWDDGEIVICTLEAFIESNADEIAWQDVRDLREGKSVSFGGGAAPFLTVEVLPCLAVAS